MGDGTSNPSAGTAERASLGTPRDVAVDSIQPSRFQPRRAFSQDELEELAQSIRQYGVLQPVVVRPWAGGYELIAGERRWRAAKIAEVSVLPAWVREASDDEMTALALIENIQRQDLNAMEEAEAYHRLAEELGWTQEAIAEHVGKARSHIGNYLRLMQLDSRIQDWIRSRQLTMAHAKVLLAVEDEAWRQELAERAVLEQWTVRELEERRVRSLGSRAPEMSRRQTLDVHMRQVEEGLRRALGVAVRLKGDGQKGRIEIRYASLEELERLVEVLANSDSAPERFPV
jgi:ParB family chromosome partitioning protein